jgi:hypothetical protein
MLIDYLMSCGAFADEVSAGRGDAHLRNETHREILVSCREFSSRHLRQRHHRSECRRPPYLHETSERHFRDASASHEERLDDSEDDTKAARILNWFNA